LSFGPAGASGYAVPPNTLVRVAQTRRKALLMDGIWLLVFRFRHLSRLGVPHGLTRRHRALPGQGNVGFAGAPLHEVVCNRERWWRAIGLDWQRTVFARQVHGTTILTVTAQDAGRGARLPDTALPSSDGLATAEVELPLAVLCADCAPILLYDPVNHVAGALHAGWRGTVDGIAVHAVQTLRAAFGTDPDRLLVGIGPTIGPCCYEVGDEVIEGWSALGIGRAARAVTRVGGHWRFDLVTANRLALESAGVAARNIEVAGICTRCRSDEWFSHRAARAGTALPGHFAAVIAVPLK